jgi:hypothetical protein
MALSLLSGVATDLQTEFIRLLNKPMKEFNRLATSLMRLQLSHWSGPYQALLRVTFLRVLDD